MVLWLWSLLIDAMFYVPLVLISLDGLQLMEMFHLLLEMLTGIFLFATIVTSVRLVLFLSTFCCHSVIGLLDTIEVRISALIGFRK